MDNAAGIDGAWVEALRDRTPESAARLMQRHNRKLWRIARSIVRDDSDAEEVVQEAYLRAFTSLGSFRGEASLGTWLARITINEALRRAQRRDALAGSADLGEETAADPSGRHLPQPANPEQSAARAEIRSMVERAIDALPAPFRLVFVMRVVEQMSIEETAAALCIPAATVKSRLHRANQQLRDALGAELAAMLEGAFPFGGLRCERLVRAVLARLAGAPGGAFAAISD
jgi:RNA polymerase sigma-70 factor (ECF subfamily)